MIVSPLSCIFYRFAGSLLTCTCIFTIIVTFRHFYHRFRRCQNGLPILPLSPILIGMLISLMMILCTGIPLILIQCFICRPLKFNFGFCKINAFICFAIGNFNIYMLVLLSMFRYINIIHENSSFSRFLRHYRRLNVIICAFISLCWSVPPLLNVGNTYTDEGIGFHCSLDWNNPAFQSRFFLYSLLICNYFFLLIILIYSNLRVYFVLRHLFKSNELNSSLMSTILHLSIANVKSSSNLIDLSDLQPNIRKRLSDRQLKRKLNRSQRLKLDQRYACITAIMVSLFIISWTPYAILALIIINGKIEFIRQYPIFSTVSELLAKFSLVINPLILIYTSKTRRY